MNAFNHFPLTTALALGLGLLFAPGRTTLAQTPDDNRPPTTDTADSTLNSAIALYRTDVRRAALLVSQQPQVITSLAQQQGSSQQGFDALMLSYGKNKQGWFYDIARFPATLHKLAMLPHRADKSEGKTIAGTLPPDSQNSAWRLYRHHHDDLVRADSINQQAEHLFDRLMVPLDRPTQTAFRQLLIMPDVLTLLAQEIDKTTRLGQAYRADSVGIVQQLSSLHDSLTVQNQRELADFQRELNEDPLAQQELQQAGQAYALANRYNTGTNPNTAMPDSSSYYQNPYSFWSGYPSWYSAPLWYPSAWAYNTGYYYGLGGNMVFFGLPSPGFCNWFFSRGYRAYPHLCNRFNSYYTRNVGSHRYWAHGNGGFMSAAHRTFGPRTDGVGGGSNWLTNPRRYSRSNSVSGSGTRSWSTGSTFRYHSTPSRSYHPSSRSSSVSHSRSFSSGHSSSSSHHSSGFHGSSHHSGGSRGGHR